MKKLMVAAAIVCATVAAHAASFDWMATDAVYGIDPSALSSGLKAGTTYAVGSDTIDDLSWTVGYMLTLSNGEASDVLSGTLETDGSGYPFTFGLESALVVQDDPAVTLDYTLVYTATVTDGQGQSWDITSNTVEGKFLIPPKGDVTLDVAGATSWSTAAVPEPTSGLLLLLGVAGLALRRRRA